MNRSVLAFVAGALLTTGVVQAQAYRSPDVDSVGGKEAQPHMHAAIAALRTARAEIDKASDGKGGHRKAAIELTNKAIDEVQAGIAADNANGPDKK